MESYIRDWHTTIKASPTRRDRNMVEIIFQLHGIASVYISSQVVRNGRLWLPHDLNGRSMARRFVRASPDARRDGAEKNRRVPI
jgi:hypothetical protein